MYAVQMRMMKPGSRIITASHNGIPDDIMTDPLTIVETTVENSVEGTVEEGAEGSVENSVEGRVENSEEKSVEEGVEDSAEEGVEDNVLVHVIRLDMPMHSLDFDGNRGTHPVSIYHVVTRSAWQATQATQAVPRGAADAAGDAGAVGEAEAPPLVPSISRKALKALVDTAEIRVEPRRRRIKPSRAYYWAYW